jgi:hypothetical protein
LLTLILILLLVWFVVVVVLAAWTLFIQGYLYTEPVAGIAWRAPAAGSVVMTAFLLWVVLDYHSPGAYRPVHELESSEVSEPFPELIVPTREGEKVYKREGNKYRMDRRAGGLPLPGRPEKIIVVEGGERYVFEPQPERKSSSGASEPRRYMDSRGRVMEEYDLGVIRTFRTGRFVANLLLNLLFLTACFAALWPLLRFSWGAALGQAIVLCGVMLLFVLPPVLTRAEATARQRAAQKAAP